MSDVIEFQRRFIAKDLKVGTWDDVKSYAEDLKTREWKNATDYRRWLEDWDEFGVVTGEEGCWRYIRITIDTESEDYKNAYQSWINDVSTQLSVLENELSKRMIASPFNDQIIEQGFELLLKRTKAGIELFRDENVALQAKEAEKSAEYGEISAMQTIELDGKTLTLQQAGTRMEWPDRAKREETWHAVNMRRYQDKEKFDHLYDELVANRHQIALNAGEKNFRDYQFKAYQRFDYTAKECFAFHEAIEKAVMPIVSTLTKKRKADMGVEQLRPWDLKVDVKNRPAIIAFKDSHDLVDKTIQMLDNTAPFAADTVRRMKAKNLLDLDSRKGKAPGGYNSGLPETRSSFMFTNQAQTARDMETAVHEAGHATHDRLASAQSLYAYQHYPMELAELASMSMELLTHDQWNIFFKDEEECARVRYNHLKSIIEFFPQMAKIDAYQHAIYENPTLTPEQRHDVWEKLQHRFSTNEVDWSGLNNDYLRTSWHGILHIFEVPFYYVEYGIAQLGALQIWRNYKQDKKQAIEQYKNALSLGYTRSIPETYTAAGVKFDFSVDMIKDLMGFVQSEMEKLVRI